jgi:hypothetical protein
VRVSSRAKLIATIAAVVVVGGGIAAFFLIEDFGKSLPIIGEAVDSDVCPMSGDEPPNSDEIERPAVAIKVENAQVAYPLSGLQDAELVYEELVEGGVTRFMVMYHCNDSKQVGPVRSARVVDPAIMIPKTRILAYSGQNKPVLDALEEADIVRIDESNSKGSMERVPREGLTAEHTLYADSAKVRDVGSDDFDEQPPDDLFKFGDLEGDTGNAETVLINFSALTNIKYVFAGGSYERFQPLEQEFVDATSGDPIEVDNVLIEEHEIKNSETIVDVNGNPSTEIVDETGSGRAFLFRDGKVIEGTWSRKNIDEQPTYETKDGDEMVFKEGNIWVHLVPSKKGEIKGSFKFEG